MVVFLEPVVSVVGTVATVHPSDDDGQLVIDSVDHLYITLFVVSLKPELSPNVKI